jgi:hypothetical protein
LALRIWEILGLKFETWLLLCSQGSNQGITRVYKRSHLTFNNYSLNIKQSTTHPDFPPDLEDTCLQMA